MNKMNTAYFFAFLLHFHFFLNFSGCSDFFSYFCTRDYLFVLIPMLLQVNSDATPKFFSLVHFKFNFKNFLTYGKSWFLASWCKR